MLKTKGVCKDKAGWRSWLRSVTSLWAERPRGRKTDKRPSWVSWEHQTGLRTSVDTWELWEEQGRRWIWELNPQPTDQHMHLVLQTRPSWWAQDPSVPRHEEPHLVEVRAAHVFQPGVCRSAFSSAHHQSSIVWWASLESGSHRGWLETQWTCK